MTDQPDAQPSAPLAWEDFAVGPRKHWRGDPRPLARLSRSEVLSFNPAALALLGEETTHVTLSYDRAQRLVGVARAGARPGDLAQRKLTRQRYRGAVALGQCAVGGFLRRFDLRQPRTQLYLVRAVGAGMLAFSLAAPLTAEATPDAETPPRGPHFVLGVADYFSYLASVS